MSRKNKKRTPSSSKTPSAAISPHIPEQTVINTIPADSVSWTKPRPRIVLSTLAKWIAATVPIVASVFGVWVYFADHKAKISKVEEQFLISPVAGSNGQNWAGTLILTNDGPATAKHLSCTFLIENSNYRFMKPELLGADDSGADITTGVTQSTANISIKDLSPSRGVSFVVPINVPPHLAADLQKSWESLILKPEFARKLINNLDCGGQDIETADTGFTAMPTSNPRDK